MTELPEPPEDNRTMLERSENFLDYLEEFLSYTNTSLGDIELT